jgi:hypothetical protein
MYITAGAKAKCYERGSGFAPTGSGKGGIFLGGVGTQVACEKCVCLELIYRV